MDSVSELRSEQIQNNSRVTVSLTTYPARIDRVHKTIESLIRQTVKADQIVLWLAEEQFPDGESSLPEQLLAQKEQGLTFEWCSDIKSYKKIIPAAEKWPEDIIITADDDIIYELNTIERLLESYRRHPDCVSTLRTHLMLFDGEGFPLPYESWKPEYSGFVDQPLMALFPTTGAGTLFPPGILPDEAFDQGKFMSLCPSADDVWIKCMLTLAGVPVVLADINTKLQYVEGTQAETLYSHNITANDDQLRAVIGEYNEIGGPELPDDTMLIRMNDLSDYTPDDSLCQKYRKGRSFVNEKTGIKVSIILSGEYSERRFMRCLNSVRSQSLREIEIICAIIGNPDIDALRDAAGKDERITIIEIQESCSATEARRRAVLESKGEYCLIPDIDGMLAPDACEQLYTRAEDGDADILAFTRGVIIPRESSAQPLFTGYEGRIRNRDILQKEFASGSDPSGKLFGCLFGGRAARKAYLHADCSPDAGDIYEYFLLCRASEVYVGVQTEIYSASTVDDRFEPDAAQSDYAAIKDFISFARLDDDFEQLMMQTRKTLIASEIESMLALPSGEHSDCFAKIKSAWGEADTAAAIAVTTQRYGEIILRELFDHPTMTVTRESTENVAVMIGSPGSARELFIMTEIVDCIAGQYKATLVGIDKHDAAGAVISAKIDYDGANLGTEEARDAMVYAQRFDEVLNRIDPDAIIVWTGSDRFLQTALHARLRGIPVVAVMTEPPYNAMLDCRRPNAGLSALRLANVAATDNTAQCRLLDAMGISARYIPRPAIRLMGGRSSGRAANAIVWTGSDDDSRSRMGDALDIFRRVRTALPEAQMLIYLDGETEIGTEDQLPEGVTVRRLRPDYGIFSDAALQLITGAYGASSEALRAGRTLGIPAVVYSRRAARNAGGVITVQPGDRAGAAVEIIRLMKDKALREQLSAQAKTATGAGDRNDVSARWCEMLGELSRRSRVPDDELGFVLCEVMDSYEDGALYNADRLEEYRQRCDDYERQLEAAEQRRLREEQAHSNAIENLRAMLREKERERAHTAAKLEDIENSTSYKAGSAITSVPRSIKKLISRLRDNKE